MTVNRRAEAHTLSEEILTDIELSRLRATEVLRKTTRLARLLDDLEAQAWLSVEIQGYDANRDSNGKLTPAAWKAARRSGRVSRSREGKETAKVESVGKLDSIVVTYTAQLNASADAPVSISSANPHQYVMAPEGNAMQRAKIAEYLADSGAIIELIVGALHQYVTQKQIELRFGAAVESSFNRIRAVIDARIGHLVPDAVTQLAAAFELTASANPEHWTDAASYCRKLLIAVSDKLQPAGSDIGNRKNGSENYVNRLAFWIEQRIASGTGSAIVVADLEDFGKRLDAVSGAGNKGAHARNITQSDADRFLVGTYILLGDILSLARVSALADPVAPVAPAEPIAPTQSAPIQPVEVDTTNPASPKTM